MMRRKGEVEEKKERGEDKLERIEKNKKGEGRGTEKRHIGI